MNARDRRALLWGGVAIAGAALALRGIPWTVETFARLHRAAVERQAVLAQARMVLADRLAVQDSLGRVLTGIVALAPRLVEGRTAAEAQASLSALMSLAAGRQALKVVRLDPLPDSGAGVFSRVAVHAELEGDIAGVARLLRAVETAAPLLSVVALAISAPDPASVPRQAEVMRVELDVVGYYVPRGQ